MSRQPFRRWAYSFSMTFAAALIAASCGWIVEDDTYWELQDAIAARQLSAIQEIVEQHPDLMRGDHGVMALTAASCDPAIARLLVDDLGFDVRSPALGGVIYQAVSSLESHDPTYSSDCTEEDVYASLRFFLDEGADPCLAPKGDQAGIVAREAASWGASSRTVELLRQGSVAC